MSSKLVNGSPVVERGLLTVCSLMLSACASMRGEKIPATRSTPTAAALNAAALDNAPRRNRLRLRLFFRYSSFDVIADEGKSGDLPINMCDLAGVAPAIRLRKGQPRYKGLAAASTILLCMAPFGRGTAHDRRQAAARKGR